MYTKLILNKIFASFLVTFTLLVFPFSVSAVAGTGGGGAGTGITYVCPTQSITNPDGSITNIEGECTFQDLIKATKNLVNWGTTFAVSFSVIVIAYAGFLYMISGDNAGKRKEANTMLMKVVIGLVYILAAWLIVTTILKGLGAYDTSYAGKILQ